MNEMVNFVVFSMYMLLQHYEEQSNIGSIAVASWNIGCWVTEFKTPPITSQANSNLYTVYKFVLAWLVVVVVYTTILF